MTTPVQQWNGTYAATVVNNDDPLGVGRLQLNVPQVLGNAVSTWAVPSGSYYSIPNNGTTVSCVFIGGDPSQPAWNGPLDLSPIVESAAPPTVSYATSAPLSPRVGDIWYDTAGGEQGIPQVWTYNSGTSTFSWVAQSPLNGAATIKAGSLTSSIIGNLGTVLNANPFFSGGAVGQWVAANGTVGVVSTWPAQSTYGAYPYALKFTSASSGSGRAGAYGDTFGIVQGSTYVFTAWVYSSTGAIDFGFDWLDSTGTFISSAPTTQTITANTWTLISCVHTATPPTAAYAYGFVGYSAPVSGATMYIQAAQSFPQIQGIVDATTITGAVINGGVFNGANWISNSLGSFMYSGTPAAGNLAASFCPASGYDGFGNQILAGMTIYNTGTTPVTCINFHGQGLFSYTATTQAGPYSGSSYGYLSFDTSPEIFLQNANGGFQVNATNGTLITGSTAQGITLQNNTYVTGSGLAAQLAPVTGVTGGGATTINYYGEICQINIPAQFDDSHVRLLVMGNGFGASAAAAATVNFRVKQQAAMGSLPYVELYVTDCTVFTPANFTAVTTVTSGSVTTVQLYVQAPQDYESYNVHLLGTSANASMVSGASGGGQITFPAANALAATLPSGLQFTTGAFLGNPWVTFTSVGYTGNFGAGTPGARYRIEGDIVRLDGVVNATGTNAANAAAFTFPVGARPTATKRFAGDTNATYTAGASTFSVASTGVLSVVPATVLNNVIILDGFSFPIS